MDLENRPPRLSIEIDQELKDRLDKVIHWGQGKRLIEVLIIDLVETLESLNYKEREVTKALIISRRVKTKDVLPSLNEEV